MPRWFLPVVSSFVVSASMLAAAAELGFSSSVTPGMVSHYESLFGRSVSARFGSWQEFVRRTKASAASAEEIAGGALLPVNRFFNRVPGISDADHWKAEDYWATPAETLASDGADCEDYAIAKFYALKELGVPISQLRLVYVRSDLAGAHMVLAWYASPGADPLILDNLEGSLRPASQRTDLHPVYSFNDEDLELARPNAPALHANPASNRKWASVLVKLRQELAY